MHTGGGSCKEEKDIDCPRRRLPGNIVWLFAKFSQIELRFVHVDITIAAINATHLLGIYL
jgi:hypothetical protein